jgi:hypothetical protein
MKESGQEYFDREKKIEMTPTEAPEHKSDDGGVEIPATEKLTAIKERPGNLNHKIQVLKNEITQIKAARQRVDRLQTQYAVPDANLTKFDTDLIKRPLESLEAQLQSLKAEKKKKHRSLKTILKSFFSM